MLVYKYVLVATLFVFTSKTAQSFILLTANVADIKKIAQRFVSDDMADKLAHTVVKVIGNLNSKKGTNLDDELKKIEETTYQFSKIFQNERPDKLNFVNIHNADQQRFKKATRSPDDDFSLDDSGDIQSIYKDGHKKRTKKYLNNWEINLKSQDTAKKTSGEEPKRPFIAEMKSVSHQQKQKYLMHTRTTKKPVEYTIRTTRHKYRNYESNEIQSRYVPDLKPILSPELTHKNQKLFDNSPSSDRKRQQRNHFELKSADDDEQQQNKQQANENQEPERVTTKREKYEFDQYDNLNYPKIGSYIATSGPVALPAMPSEKQWWEKDLPDRRKMEK